MTVRREREFRKELAELLNRHSADASSNTPDFILANYLTACLDAFDVAQQARRIAGGTVTL